MFVFWHTHGSCIPTPHPPLPSSPPSPSVRSKMRRPCCRCCWLSFAGTLPALLSCILPPNSAIIGYTTERALFIGTFLQTLPELVTPLKGHSLSAPSSKLCQNWLHHWRGTLYRHLPPNCQNWLHHWRGTLYRHLSPKSARTGYTTGRSLFISAQMSTSAVSSLQKVWVLIRLWKQHSFQSHM